MHSAPLTGRIVLVVHAHPDDEAIFTGLTISRLTTAGARVVLLTATDGAEGTPIVPLPRGRSLTEQRYAELEDACAVLGVARLVVLPFRDSGMRGSAAGGDPRALANADLLSVGHTLADLVMRERAEAVIHYDADGIYRHPDHVAVHLIGTAAARLAGVTAYEATVDREHLHFTPPHLVEGRGPRVARPSAGRSSAEITTAVAASGAALIAKREAMRAHVSQIPGAHVDAAGFEQTYGLEWFVRRGGPGVLESLGNAHSTAMPLAG